MRKMKQRLLNGVRRCSCCGAKMLFQGYNTDHRLSRLMEQRMICYECAFWWDLIDFPPKDIEITSSKVLKINPFIENKEKTMYLGGKGKVRYFMRPDGTLIKSNDVWTVGTIPERFLPLLKRTLFEIAPWQYYRMFRYPGRCKAKACFDRYRCLRYKIEIENKRGAYNIVPKYWKIGGEHCKSFLDNQAIK